MFNMNATLSPHIKKGVIIDVEEIKTNSKIVEYSCLTCLALMQSKKNREIHTDKESDNRIVKKLFIAETTYIWP